MDSITHTTAASYQPFSSETRVKDFEIPKYLTFGGTMIKVPKGLHQKDIHYLLDELGKPVRCAWISKPIAHLLNSMRFENSDLRVRELERAIDAVDVEIQNLVRVGVLKDKHGPGAMSFCQTHENVPKGHILISERTFKTLVATNPKWEKTKTVAVPRFPNLGPATTQELRIIVNATNDKKPISSTSIGARLPNLASLLEEVEDTIDLSGVLDPFYVNQKDLKDGFQGDCDGDQLFITRKRNGYPIFREISLVRESADISEDDVNLLLKKANRLDRNDLSSWLGTYFDDVPIGPATYAIRWMLFNTLPKYKNSDHPMHEAWKEIAPRAIEMIEFVMDIRKGEWTNQQIETKMAYIKDKQKEISAAQETQNWFALTVTSSKSFEVAEFIKRFRTLQAYMDFVTGQTNTIRSMANE